jgi:hypothetical protein
VGYCASDPGLESGRIIPASFRYLPPGATACSSAACSQLVQVGSTVMVLPSVSSPQFGWGAVTRSSVGTVISISGNTVTVNFPEQSGWSAAIAELQVVCAISGCSAGSYQPSGWTSCAVCSAGALTVTSPSAVCCRMIGRYGCSLIYSEDDFPLSLHGEAILSLYSMTFARLFCRELHKLQR